MSSPQANSTALLRSSGHTLTLLARHVSYAFSMYNICLNSGSDVPTVGGRPAPIVPLHKGRTHSSLPLYTHSGSPGRKVVQLGERIRFRKDKHKSRWNELETPSPVHDDLRSQTGVLPSILSPSSPTPAPRNNHTWRTTLDSWLIKRGPQTSDEGDNQPMLKKRRLETSEHEHADVVDEPAAAASNMPDKIVSNTVSASYHSVLTHRC